eukprot:CAMPEP_0172492474 /NCGR_PEP_ID=MMETSP1066-20121228/23654_1 /TAXON_ID=671091 /ORGANISM="Coscinodiscus wailesii, Strain CCMP2513" /LENGTH=588 /DNA_ID=CAMNT_0013262139 /DNA_START=416 /DNA_END=2182 /DNA_ORIENTATION=+
MVSIWSNHLSLKPVQQPITIPPNVCFNMLDPPLSHLASGVPDADLLLFVSAVDCENAGNLAYAFPCAQDQYDRPIIGSVTFCLESMADDPTDRDVQGLIDIAIHELGHVLGLSSNLMAYFRDWDDGMAPRTKRPLKSRRIRCADGKRRHVLLPSESTLSRTVTDRKWSFEVVTPTVRTVVRNQFNCSSILGARLENQPTNPESCFGSHWDERFFFTETMGPIYSYHRGNNVLSALTMALLEDSGWYKANYTSVRVSSFGHAAGCDFVNGDCIVGGGNVPSYGKGFFCNHTSRFDANGAIFGDWICDNTHSGMALCDLFPQESNNFAVAQRTKDMAAKSYFTDAELVPLFEHADFCPIPHISTLSCSDTRQKALLKYESFGYDAKCFNLAESYNSLNAICLKTKCHSKNHVLEVFLGSRKVVCEYDGQVHYLDEEAKGRPMFECPRLATVCPHLFCPANCSGKGTCDYSLSKPKCNCFDPQDQSEGCFGVDFTAQNVVPAEDDDVQFIAMPPTEGPIVQKNEYQVNNTITNGTLYENETHHFDDDYNIFTVYSFGSGGTMRSLKFAIITMTIPTILQIVVSCLDSVKRL